MKARRLDLWLWKVEAEIRWWLRPPPAEFWVLAIPLVVTVLTALVWVLWRQGEIR